MRSEKQRQRQREEQRRKRERRREHARLALVLLADELDLPSMSGQLIAFAEPLRRLLPQDAGRARAREHYEELLHVAALVWNAAQAFEGARLAQGLLGATQRLVRLTGVTPEVAASALRPLVELRRTRYAREPRYLGGVEVVQEGAGDWRVLVVSRQLPPAQRADGGGDEELRPSSLRDEEHGGHFIV